METENEQTGGRENGNVGERRNAGTEAGAPTAVRADIRAQQELRPTGSDGCRRLATDNDACRRIELFSRRLESQGKLAQISDQDVYGNPTPRFRECVAGANPRPRGYIERYGRSVEEKVGGLRRAALRESGKRVSIALRPFQIPVFTDRSSGILILHWARQIGKSFVLAAWAVDRLLTRPGRLVTVLSNSRDNGAEFVAKCAEVCRLNGTDYETKDRSQGVRFQNMRMEVRIRAQGKTGRIKVLAANPRTARGFSGDLILDEFAFHEDSAAIWEAAEPILASNKDFLCRMASTGNGKHNLFYRMVAGMTERMKWVKTENEKVGKPESGTGGVEPLIDANEDKLEGEEGKDATDERRNIEHPTSNAELRTGEMLETPHVVSYDEEKDERINTEHPTSNSELRTGEMLETPHVVSYEKDGECRGVLVGTGIGRSRAGFAVSRISRTEAFEMGVKIYDANTREEVTPSQARAAALDKRAYDQNYECAFADENLTLLSHALIDAAEREDVGFICEQDWGTPVNELVSQRMSGWNAPSAQWEVRSGEEDYPRSHDRGHGGHCGHGVIDFLRNAVGRLYVGFDVARRGDLSVITVMEELGGLMMVRGILRMQNLRLPEQQERLGEVCRLPRFHRAAIDMTGLGLGLLEYAQEEFGSGKIRGINFATTVPATRAVRRDGHPRERVRVTEALAMELLQRYEDRRIQHPAEGRLRDDLRKPEKITTPGGRVSIAATRDEAGHADHFWSFALAVEAGARGGGGGAIQLIPRERRVLL